VAEISEQEDLDSSTRSTVDDSTERPNFVLTTEWQEVPEGVRLSAPVHVRLHRRTGKKLAKLVDLDGLDDLPNAHCFVVQS
jgi:hypothetical protein